MAKQSFKASRAACSQELSTELTARAMEWENLAAKIEQRAEAWHEESARWHKRHDTRAPISSYREQWVTDQAQQFAAWLRLAANHLFVLASNETP
jgi:hypothetical protein